MAPLVVNLSSLLPEIKVREQSAGSSPNMFPLTAALLGNVEPLPEAACVQKPDSSLAPPQDISDLVTDPGDWEFMESTLSEAPSMDVESRMDLLDVATEQSDCDHSDAESSCRARAGSDDASAGGRSSRSLPVKATFIHFDVAEFSSEDAAVPMLKRSASAASILMTCPYTTVQPLMQEVHERGECKPCAYFLLKVDGCRWGANCEFCHLCPPGELKKRKKEKAKTMKIEEQRVRSEKFPQRGYGRRAPWCSYKGAKPKAW